MDDTKITTQSVSIKLRNTLIKKGFRFEPVKIIHLYGRKKVFGVKIDVSKIMKGKNIKELLIRIPANTHEELIEKTKLLISKVKELAKVDCQMTIWDKLEKC